MHHMSINAQIRPHTPLALFTYIFYYFSYFYIKKHATVYSVKFFSLIFMLFLLVALSISTQMPVTEPSEYWFHPTTGTMCLFPDIMELSSN